MTVDEYKDFAHDCVHWLIDKNRILKEQFEIGSFERWDYDQETALFKWLSKGVTRVSASFQFAGTFAFAPKSWMWSWANESLWPTLTSELLRVREFGEREGISALVEPTVAASEESSWELTAIAAKLLNCRGAYRCGKEDEDQRSVAFVLLKDIWRVA